MVLYKRKKAIDDRELIEQQITDFLSKDSKSWVQVYRLMEEVYLKRLYLPEYRSFTDWVRAIATLKGCSMATIWHRRRAGKFYDEYYSRAVAKGVQPLELEQVRINPENLNIIQKLIGADTEAGDELIEKLLRKEVTYTDLRLMWHSVREKNTGTRRKNGYDSVSYSFNNYEFESKVILALKNSAWLLGKKTAKLDGRQYKLLQGIKIDGLEAKPDATIIEAVNSQEEVKLHFVQIQTRLVDNSPLELLNSYVANLGDYIWLVLPQEEVRRARDLWESYDWRSVGIIGYAEETEALTIFKPAEPCTARYEFERRMRKLDAVVKYLL